MAGIAEGLIGFGAMAFVRGMPTEAVRLLVAVVALGGTSLLAPWPAERLEYEHYLAAARAELTGEAFEAAQAEGGRLTVAAATELALSLPPVPPIPAATPQAEFGGLSAREREVAALVGRGKSNSEIADELVLSKRTVEKHVANILSKLQLTSRAQLVRWAIEHGLT